MQPYAGGGPGPQPAAAGARMGQVPNPQPIPLKELADALKKKPVNEKRRESLAKARKVKEVKRQERLHELEKEREHKSKLEREFRDEVDTLPDNPIGQEGGIQGQTHEIGFMTPAREYLQRMKQKEMLRLQEIMRESSESAMIAEEAVQPDNFTEINNRLSSMEKMIQKIVPPDPTTSFRAEHPVPPLPIQPEAPRGIAKFMESQHFRF